MRARSGTIPSSSSSKTVRRYISVVSISPCAVKVPSPLERCYAPRPIQRTRKIHGGWHGGVPADTAPRSGGPGVTRRASRREPLDQPAAAVAAVPQPVVQPVRAALPELESLGSHPVPAPELRHRDLRSLGPAPGQRGIPPLEAGAGP